MGDNNNQQIEQPEPQPQADNVIQQIVQNGVSKDELKSMLTELLKPEVQQDLNAAELEKANAEYFNDIIKF